MKSNSVVFVLIALLVSFVFVANGDFMLEELVSVGLFVFFLLSFIDSIGKSYNPLDLPILLALFQCMIMPMVVYRVFNEEFIVVALKYDMTVDPRTYYGYVFPSILVFIVGVKAPLLFSKNMQLQFRQAMIQSKSYLEGKGNIGILLIIIGASIGVLQPFIPGELNYVAYLISKLLIVGVLYTFLSNAKNRLWFLIGGITFLFVQALAMAMFGDLVYTLMLGVLLILLGRNISNKLKYSVTLVGLVFLILIQSIKTDYRAVVWKGKDEENLGKGAFFTLLADRITNPGQLLEWDSYFPIIVRANQGMIVGKVMGYIPNYAPYSEGETIFTAIAASFVPRLLWEDKPMSGGHANMLRFTGLTIQGYSMNIGPIGEAYGNFGVDGGIVFMLFYGLFFSFAVVVILRFIKKRPTLILWFPLLFLNSVQMETDVLLCVNSFLKNAIFCWFCFWAFDRFLRIKL